MKIKNYNKFKASKKAVTFAGGLVFFFLLGLVPTLYLFSLTLSLFGKELSNLGGFFITEKFSVIKEFVFSATENIGAGGSVVAGFIAVYSAGSLFVHLRYTGEVIYNQKSTSTILVRILSIIASITVSLSVSFLIAVYGVLSPFFLSVLGFLGKIINFFIAMAITFIAIIIINLTACPKKIKIKDVIKGSLFTCVFGVIFTAVFLIYLRYFSSYDKIYGQIAVIPIFFAWLFIIMRCIVSGITINAYERLTKK